MPQHDAVPEIDEKDLTDADKLAMVTNIKMAEKFLGNHVVPMLFDRGCTPDDILYAYAAQIVDMIQFIGHPEDGFVSQGIASAIARAVISTIAVNLREHGYEIPELNDPRWILHSVRVNANLRPDPLADAPVEGSA